jgi:hypothetical protein
MQTSGGMMMVRPASPLRQPVTQVKEFKFASEARSRRSPERMKANLEKERSQSNRCSQVSAITSPRKSIVEKKVVMMNVEKKVEEQAKVADDEVVMDQEVDEGFAVRMKAHEIGKASILAWGETRGRYLEQ